MTTRRRFRWWWILVGLVAVMLVLVAIVAVPILTHTDQGQSTQVAPTVEWPLSVTAEGDDGRTRSFTVSSDQPLDTSSLAPGDRLIVTGTGYDSARGIYVAICKIPASSDIKPGPCLGGVPVGGEQDVATGTIQYAASNWINNDWAWKLFGSRGYDDASTGAFTAYLEVGEPTEDKLDCTVEACGIFTRNDHTALNDRVQDLYVPVGFTSD